MNTELRKCDALLFEPQCAAKSYSWFLAQNKEMIVAPRCPRGRNGQLGCCNELYSICKEDKYFADIKEWPRSLLGLQLYLVLKWYNVVKLLRHYPLAGTHHSYGVQNAVAEWLTWRFLCLYTSQVQIPALPLRLHVIILSKLITRSYSGPLSLLSFRCRKISSKN